MNPNFRFRFLRKTVRACIRGIGPRNLGIQELDEHVLQTLEHQLKCFPFWHRLGFVLGLSFLEWGMCIGGWGIIPIRFLSDQGAQKRLQLLSKSRLHPLRFFIHGLKVLICLAAYTHPKVEEYYGFERRKWRKNRVQFRDRLEWAATAIHHQSESSKVPFIPEALAPLSLINPHEYLAWDASEKIVSLSTLSEVSSSPFQINVSGEVEVHIEYNQGDQVRDQES